MYIIASMVNYKDVYDENYFNGKNSFFWQGGYGHNWGFAWIYFDNLYRQFIPYIKQYSQANVLDVGCAYGLMLKRFPSDFHKYGIDVSQHAIARAKQILPHSKFAEVNVENSIPFKNNFFDIVTCNDVIEHLERPDAALIQIYKVLKPGGILYLTTPNFNWLRKVLFAYPDRREHHISLIPHKTLETQLQQIGFKVKKRWTFSNIFIYIRYPGTLGIESAFICTKKKY